MKKRNIDSRIGKVEMILEQDLKEAISKLNFWIETNPEDQQEAFWRAVYHEFEWDDEGKDLLTGGQEYQPEDLEVAVSLMERAPQDLLKNNAFY